MKFGCARALAAVVRCAVIVSAASVAAGASEDPATVAYNDALELVRQARKTPSPAERWTLYETAHSYMSQIKRMLANSEPGRQLWDDTSRAASQFADVKKALLETGKAVCDQDFAAKCVLRFALDVVQIAEPPYTGDIYLEISKAQAAVGDIAGAFATIELASSSGVSAAIPAIMAAMVRAADLDGALVKAKGFHRARDRDIALLSIVRTLGKKGDVDNGRIVAAQISNPGDRIRALATVAAASRSADESTALFADAFALARTVSDAEARAKLLFEVAKLQLAADHTAQARETLEAALAATRAMPEPRERRYTLYYLKQYSKETFSAAARAIADEIQEKAAQIDVNRDPIELVFDDAEATIDSGDYRGAKALLERAREMALELTDENSRDMVYEEIITNRLKMGDFEGALRAWARMRGPYRPSGALREIGTAQAKAGDFEGLRRLLALVDLDSRGHFIRWSIVPQLAETGRLVEAHDFASQIVNDSYYHPKAMIEIAKGEAAAGDFDAAVETALSIQYVGYRTDALHEIAAEHFRQGRAGEAKALLHDAFRGMFGAGGVLSGIIYYKPILEAFSDIGKLLAEIEASG